MNEENKIIACSVKTNEINGTSQVDFINRYGVVTGVCLDRVLSANVTGDQIVVLCEARSTHSRYINVYDVYTCRHIKVIPA